MGNGARATPARGVGDRLAGLAPVFVALLFTGCGNSQSHAPCRRGEPDWVAGGGECLHIETFRSRELSDRPRLVVALHGDAPFHNPGYQYLWARRIAEENRNVVAVGLLRPGYTDPEGHRSSGRRGLTTGDNYTPDRIDALAEAIRSLARAHHASEVLIAGHSGGGAITADLMGRHPGLAAAALIVSCPCNVPQWRKHMRETQGGFVWRLPVRSLSPHELAGTVDPKARIAIVVGERDAIAPPRFSREYRDRLVERGVRVEYVELQGRDHEIFLDEATRAAAARLLADAAAPASANGNGAFARSARRSQ